jgi:hypothetical protein
VIIILRPNIVTSPPVSFSRVAFEIFPRANSRKVTCSTFLENCLFCKIFLTQT